MHACPGTSKALVERAYEQSSPTPSPTVSRRGASRYSLWPARYIQLLKHASNRHSKSRIIVPLSMVLQGVYDGVIELHNPVSDLEDL
ncbi:hypothetical protein EDB19DRAFT_2041415 [Suillus lakei]|nr:hypothetical protein EDB19DRAFT_2041415 [Suillus lakei]